MKLLKFPGILILLYGIGFAMVSNFNMGVFMVLALGGLLTVCGIWPEQIKKITSHGIMKVVKYLIVLGLAFILGMTGFLMYQGSVDEVTYEEDALIVLGAAVQGDRVSSILAARLNEAADYAAENEEAIIIVSGGQGPQENLTEAAAMENYLMAKGLPQERIIKEEQATSTYENFKFSKEILDSKFGEEYTCAYVTNEFHCYRAGKIAEQAGLSANGVSVKTEWWKLPVNYMRESLAVVKFWILDR
jgi:uncharacterized SAM-binding protein YcdF (DUF218 family)